MSDTEKKTLILPIAEPESAVEPAFEVSNNYKGKHPKSPEELAAIRAERKANRPSPKVLRHKALCKMLNDTYMKKNEAYGDSFGKTYAELGIISAITRMSDKWNRLVNLASHPERNQVEDESIIDTLTDLANYALMTRMEIEGVKKSE